MSITQIDANGRVLLPLGIRYQLDLNDGDELAVDELGDGTIILKKIDRRLRFQEWLSKELKNK
jgi:AbrB family looped-hinge helix DNA binding protein